MGEDGGRRAGQAEPGPAQERCPDAGVAGPEAVGPLDGAVAQGQAEEEDDEGEAESAAWARRARVGVEGDSAVQGASGAPDPVAG